MKQKTGGGAAPALPPLLSWAAILASVFWVNYFLVHDVLGLLTVDEIYFAHVFWMMANGLQPFSDFYSTHLPAYFHLLGPLVPEKPGSDLTFVWALRAINLAVGAAYAWLLYRLCRREFLLLLPFLFLFIALARMAEIRPDSFGLLLVNLGWWVLLRGGGRKDMAMAAAIAGLSLFFSARAGIVLGGMGALLLFLCLRRRDPRALLLLALVAAAFAAALAILYLADPPRFLLTIRSVYLTGIPFVPTVPLWQRLLPLDRLVLLAMVAVAFGADWLRWRKDKEERALVILFACASQILLVLVDPSPFQYVYGWAALPALAGLALLVERFGRRAAAGLAIVSGAATLSLLSLSLALLASGYPPAPGSILRIVYDPPFAKGELRAMPLDRLMAMLVSTERQEGLWNQLALYEEICRRVRGPVLTRFYAHPICVPDAEYDWPGLQWPDLLAVDRAHSPRVPFERMIETEQPALIAWGKQHYRPPLSAWGREVLRDYDVHDGFAVRRVAKASPPGASAE